MSSFEKRFRARNSPPRLGGVAATKRKYREASLAGADGVVDKFDRILCWDLLNHPVCSVANAFFVAATPRLIQAGSART
jgi:hypothetical protein